MEQLREWEELRLRYAQKLRRPHSASPRLTEAGSDLAQLAAVRVQTACDLDEIQNSRPLSTHPPPPDFHTFFQVLHKPLVPIVSAQAEYCSQTEVHDQNEEIAGAVQVADSKDASPLLLSDAEEHQNSEHSLPDLPRQRSDYIIAGKQLRTYLHHAIARKLQQTFETLFSLQDEAFGEPPVFKEFHVLMLPKRPQLELVREPVYTLSNLTQLCSALEPTATWKHRVNDGYNAIKAIHTQYLAKEQWAATCAEFRLLNVSLKQWTYFTHRARTEKLKAKADAQKRRWQGWKLRQYFAGFADICAAHQQWVHDVQLNFLCGKAETCFKRWQLYIYYKHCKRTLLLSRLRRAMQAWNRRVHEKKQQKALGYVYWYQFHTHKTIWAWKCWQELSRRETEKVRVALVHYAAKLYSRVFYNWLHSRALTYYDYIPVKIAHSRSLVKTQGKLRERTGYEVKVLPSD